MTVITVRLFKSRRRYNKMSKAEEMKLERKKRKDAVDKMTAVVFTEIQKRLRKCQNKVSITIQTGPNGRHRYFTVRQYKEKVAINIYNDFKLCT